MQTICLSSQCHGGCAAVQQDPPSQRAAAQAPVPPQLKPTAASSASAGYLAACNKATINLPKRRVHSQVCSGPCMQVHHVTSWFAHALTLPRILLPQLVRSSRVSCGAVILYILAALVKNVSCCHAIILTLRKIEQHPAEGSQLLPVL